MAFDFDESGALVSTGGGFDFDESGNLIDNTPAKPRAGYQAITDTALEIGSGAAKGIKFMADAFGADNTVSKALDEVSIYAKGLQSAQAKGEDQRVAAIMQEAQDKGVWEQVKAALGAASEAPIRQSLGAIGTGLPMIAASAVPGLREASWGARLATLGGMGAVQGAGIAKDSIRDAVYERAKSEGYDDTTAAAAADKAQEYGGANTDQIALSGLINAGATATGFAPAALRAMSKEGVKRAVTPTLAKELGMGVVKEVPLEAVQGGQEQLAGNIAQQRTGFDTPLMRGVVGQAALEGMLATPGGIAGGTLDYMAPDAKPKIKPDDILKAPTVDDAIATFQAVGKQWQDLGIGPQTGSLETQRLAEQAGQSFQNLGIDQTESDLATQRRNALIAQAGKQYKALGLTDPTDDIAAQKRISEAGNEWQAIESGKQADAEWQSADKAARIERQQEEARRLMAERDARIADAGSQAKPILDRIDAENADLEDLVQSETRSKQVMLAQLESDRLKQAEIDAAFEDKPNLDLRTKAVQQAAMLDAPTALGDKLRQALAPKPVETPATPIPATPTLPRVVDRFTGMVAMPQKLAEMTAERTGGEVVRVPNIDKTTGKPNGKFAYTVLNEQNTPSPTGTQTQAAPTQETAPAREPDTAAVAVPATGTTATPVEADGVEELKKQLETVDPMSEDHYQLLQKLRPAVTDDATKSIEAGDMPVYAVGNGLHVAISPSAQSPGKFQVTRYSDKGIIGDTQYNSIDDAVSSEGLMHKERVSTDVANQVIAKSLEAESRFNEQNQPVAKAEQAQVATDGVAKEPTFNFDPMGWNPSKLADTYNGEQLNQLWQEVQPQYENRMVNGSPVDDRGMATNQRLNPAGQKIEAALKSAMGIVYQRKKNNTPTAPQGAPSGVTQQPAQPVMGQGAGATQPTQVTTNKAGNVTVYGDPAEVRKAHPQAKGVTVFADGKATGVMFSVPDSPAVLAKINPQPQTNGTQTDQTIEAEPQAQEAATRQLTDDELFTQELERLYQADIKESIKQRLGLSKPVTETVQAQKNTPFKAFLKKYKIKSSLARDIFDNAFKANQALPGTFKQDGLGLDELVTMAIQSGFMLPGDVDSNNDNGGTNKLVEMIQAEIRGEAQIPIGMASDNAQESIEMRERMDLEDEADRLGLRFDATISIDKLASMVHRVQRKIRSVKTGSLKADRVLKNAQDAAQRIERKRAELEAASEEFDKASIAEQDALLEIFMDDDGNPVIVLLSDIEANRAWYEQNPTRPQYDTSTEQDQGQVGAPDATATGQGVEDGGTTGTGTQRQDDQGQEAALESYTRADVLAEQARIEQIEKDKAKADQDAEAKAKADRIAKEIQARQEASADNFQLGQSAEDALAGQGSILDAPTVVADAQKDASPLGASGEASSGISDVLLDQPAGGDEQSLLQSETKSKSPDNTLESRHTALDPKIDALTDDQAVAVGKELGIEYKRGDDIRAKIKQAHPDDQEQALAKQSDQAKPSWHTDIPTKGVSVATGDEKLDGSRQVLYRIATEAVNALTQIQKMNGQRLYAYYLPSTPTEHGALRLFPDDQTPPKPWVLLKSEGIPVGMLPPDNLIAQLRNDLQNAPVLTSGNEKEILAQQASKPKGEATKERLTDAGEELSRNRRNKVSGITWDDVSGMNDTLKTSTVTKQNVWPKPNYEKLVEDGAPRWKVALLKSIYDKLSAKPSSVGAVNDEKLKRYIDTMTKVQSAVLAYLDKIEADPRVKYAFESDEIKKHAEKGDNMLQAAAVRGMSNIYSKAIFESVFPPVFVDGRLKSPFTAETQQGKDNNANALIIGGNNAVGALQFNYKTISKASDILLDGFPAKQEMWEKSYEVRSGEMRNDDIPEDQRNGQPQVRYQVFEKGSRYRLAKNHPNGGFATEDDAIAFAKETSKRAKDNAPLPPSRGLGLEDVKRTGPNWRNDKDVTSDDIKQAFGFRGVNLGEYVKANQKIAQVHLNHAFDALHDLADLMGVPAKAISLNGTLGLAIGAQGSGKALAHFIPGVNEINITRDSGAGALSHEWGHAIDHYFGAMQSGAIARSKEPFLTEHVHNKAEGVRPEIMAAFKTIVDAMQKRPMTEQEQKDWLESQNKRNRIRLKQALGDIAAKDKAAYEMTSIKLLAGDVGPLNKDDIPENLAKYSELTAHSRDERTKGMVYVAATTLADLKNEQKFLATHKPQTTTNFLKASAAMDAKKVDPYWSSNIEMFARSFESYVMDALSERQRESLYLSGLADGPMWKEWEEKSQQTSPYSKDSERLAINQAVQTLVDAIETKETDTGIAMFSRLNADEKVAIVRVNSNSQKSNNTVKTSPEVSALNAKMLEQEGIENAFEPSTMGDSDITKAFKKVFGVDVVAVRATGEAGMAFMGVYHNGKLYVNSEHPRAGFVQIAGHELLHHIKRENPQAYAYFADKARAYLLDGAEQKYSDRLKNAGGKDGDAYKEMLADFVGDAIADPAFLQTLADANPTRFKAFVNSVVGWLKKVAEKLRIYSLGSSQYFKDVDGLREYLTAVLDVYADTKQVPDGVAKFSLADKLSPGEEFWRKIKSNESFTKQELADAYSIGRRGSARPMPSMAGSADQVGTEAAKQVARWSSSIAGFEGYRTLGVTTGSGNFAMAIIPDELYAGTANPAIADGMILGYSFKGLPDGSYRMDISEATPGTSAFNALRENDKLKPTGKFDTNQNEYNQVVLDNPYSDSRMLMQEAVRRLAIHLGKVPTIVQAGRDTGSRAGDVNPRVFSSDFVAANFSRSLITNAPLPQTWQVPDVSKMDDFIYSIQDKHVDTKRVQQAVKAAIGAIDDAANPYLQEELYHGRASMETKEFLEKEIRPFLTDLQARGVDLSDFEEYLHNRHAERRNVQVAKINPNMQDGGSGIKTADARAYLANLPQSKRQAYTSLAKRIDAINKTTRKLLADSGLETQETIDAWTQAYGDEYVPLMREEMDNGRTGIGQGFSVRGGSSKRALGSDKPVANIFANIALQREKAITRSEKQKIGHALYGLVLKAPNPDFWFAIDPDLQRNPTQVLDTRLKLIDLGFDPADADSIAREPQERYYNPATQQVDTRINPLLRSADNVLAVRIQGQDKYVFFNAKDKRAMRMVSALKNLDADQLGAVMSQTAKMTRYFSAINTQYNPIFGVTNITRDIQTALINLESTALNGHKLDVMKHIMPALRGIYIDLRDHRAGKQPTSAYASIFEEFQREGGATGYRDMYANAEDRADAIKSEIEGIKSGKLKQVGKAIFGWLSDYNESMENAVRVAAYKVGTDNGMTKQQAASLAKNLTVNFNRKGQVALQAGALYAFFNASVQGTARIAETVMDGNKLSALGKKIVTGGLLLGGMQALLMSMADFDEDEPPDFVRERNLIIPTGGNHYISIPMPLGFHVLPNLSRIPTEWALGGFKETPKRIGQMVGLFFDAFNPIGSAGLSLQTITPTVIDPFAALAENKDFTGKDIARKDFDPLHPTAGHTRAKDTATQWAKFTSMAINYATGGTDYKPGIVSPTPDQIDYLIGQVTGGVGREVSKSAQMIESSTSGEEIPLYKIPLVGRFVGSTEGQAPETGRFYENLKRIGEHKSEIDGLRKDRRFEESFVYMRENPEARLIKLADDAHNDVSKLNRLKRDLIKQDASKERIKLIEMQITSRMKRLNDRIKAVKELEPA